MNMRQRRYLDLLKDYNKCKFLYHPGKANVVVDALSKKASGFVAHMVIKEW